MRKTILLLSMAICSHSFASTSDGESEHGFVTRIDTAASSAVKAGRGTFAGLDLDGIDDETIATAKAAAIGAGVLVLLKYGADNSAGRDGIAWDKVANAAAGAAAGYMASEAVDNPTVKAAGAAVLLGPGVDAVTSGDRVRTSAAMFGVAAGFQVGKDMSKGSETTPEEISRRCSPSMENPAPEDLSAVSSMASSVGLPAGAISGAVISGLAGGSVGPAIAGMVQIIANNKIRDESDFETQKTALPAISGITSGISAANAAYAVMGLSNPASLLIGAAWGVYNANKTSEEVVWRRDNCSATDFVSLIPTTLASEPDSNRN